MRIHQWLKVLAERKMKAAEEEAIVHEAKCKEFMDKAEEARAKRQDAAEALNALEQDALVEVPVVMEKVMEPKVLVGQTKAQKNMYNITAGAQPLTCCPAGTNCVTFGPVWGMCMPSWTPAPASPK